MAEFNDYGAGAINAAVKGLLQGMQYGQEVKERREERDENKRFREMELNARMKAEEEKRARDEALQAYSKRKDEFQARSGLINAGRRLPQLVEGQSIYDVDISNLPIDQEYLAAKAASDPMRAALQKVQLQSSLAELSEKQKPKQYEFTAGGFAKRMEGAEKKFDALLKEGFDPTTFNVQVEGLTPEILASQKSPKVKQYEQAKRDFVSAVLRKESGAAISPQEYASEAQKYFPQAGDTPEVLAQKKVSRLQALENLKAESGKAFQAIPSVPLMPMLPNESQIAPDAGLSAKEARRQELLRKAMQNAPK